MRMVSLYFSHVDGFGNTAALPANVPDAA